MKKIHFPTTRLAELAARAGGIERDAAVEKALDSLEASREKSDVQIERAIAAIEAIVYTPGARQHLTQKQMNDILRAADPVVTLAGLFRYQALDTVARSLCDLTHGLLAAGLTIAAPVVVHAQALRMLAPTSTAPSPEEIDRVLDGLRRILSHFQFVSLSSLAGRDDDDAAYPMDEGRAQM